MSMSTTRDRSRLSRRDHICDVALNAFGKYGFDGANVARIAASAGVAQPTIHYHFKTKRALWEAAMMRLGTTLARDAAAQKDVYGFLQPLDKLKATCMLLIEAASTQPVLGQVILSEGQSGGERLEWLLRNVLSNSYYEMQEILENCVQEGLIKPFKTSQLLMLLIGAAVTQFNVSPLVESIFGDDPHSEENVVAFKTMYLEVLFDGLTPEKEQ